MPRPSLRTKGEKAKPGSVPGGRHKVSYAKKKISSPKCARCGRPLFSLPRSTATIRKLPKAKKSISRMYGGHLCHLCLRDALKQKAQTL
jgi:large subunit ribosomal protein L34e